MKKMILTASAVGAGIAGLLLYGRKKLEKKRLDNDRRSSAANALPSADGQRALHTMG